MKLELQDCLNSLVKYKQLRGEQLGILRLGVFGSVARQKNTEDSDLDVVVEMEKPSLRQIYELERELNEIFNCKIDIVQMRSTLRPLLKRNIQQEAIYV